MKIGAVKLSAVASASGIRASRVEPEQHRSDAEEGADHMQVRALGAKGAGSFPDQPGQERQEAEAVAKKDDLERIEMVGEVAHQIDHDGEESSTRRHP